MGKIRGELEDLAFQYVDPISYNQVKDAIESRRKEGEAFLAEVQGVIEQKLQGEQDPGAGGSAHQAPVQHLAEAAAAAHLRRPDLRHAGAAHHHAVGDGLLRRAGHHSQPVAAGAGTHQRLHRHPAQQFLQVAAHHGHLRERACLRSADPHRRDAQDGRRRHRGALEVQGRPGLGARRAAPGVAAAGGRVAARHQELRRIPGDAEDRSLSRRRFIPSRRRARS